MRKLFLAAAAAITLSGAACAATLTLPSVTVTSAPSTSIACQPAASSYTAPLAAGAPVFNCTVSPSGWTGVVSLSGGQFVVANLSGATFQIDVGTTALAAGTYAPGTLTAVP